MKYLGINIDVQEIYTEVYTKLLRDINGLEDITKMLALSVDSMQSQQKSALFFVCLVEIY